jgi:hypothetical protein
VFRVGEDVSDRSWGRPGMWSISHR